VLHHTHYCTWRCTMGVLIPYIHPSVSNTNGLLMGAVPVHLRSIALGGAS